MRSWKTEFDRRKLILIENSAAHRENVDLIKYNNDSTKEYQKIITTIHHSISQ